MRAVPQQDCNQHPPRGLDARGNGIVGVGRVDIDLHHAPVMGAAERGEENAAEKELPVLGSWGARTRVLELAADARAEDRDRWRSGDDAEFEGFHLRRDGLLADGETQLENRRGARRRKGEDGERRRNRGRAGGNFANRRPQIERTEADRGSGAGPTLRERGSERRKASGKRNEKPEKQQRPAESAHGPRPILEPGFPLGKELIAEAEFSNGRQRRQAAIRRPATHSQRVANPL